MARITFTSVVRRYGAVTAVDRLDLDLAPGSFTGLVGANGAGKSTSLRILLALTRADEGTATIDGRGFTSLDRAAREVGALLDPDTFHPRRRGRDSLRVLAVASGLAESRVDHVLGLVGLAEAADQRTGGYSLGMRQRLALAAALLGDPETLILDEPANGLDPMGVRWLRTFLRSLADEGRTVLVSSHQLAELGQTVDDVAVIERGRLLLHEPVAALRGKDGRLSLEDAYLDLIEHEGD